MRRFLALLALALSGCALVGCTNTWVDLTPCRCDCAANALDGCVEDLDGCGDQVDGGP